MPQDKKGSSVALTPSSTSPSFERERQALTRLLATGMFTRSPNLEKILRYLCEQHFAGRSGLLKEYHLATEALGRGEDFDPKRDSIVRVEMHRLRKRLREHYENAPHETIQILIPEKSYVPEFRRVERETLESAPVATLRHLSENPPPVEQRPLGPRRLHPRWWVAALAVVLLVSIVAAVRYAPRTPARPNEFEVPSAVPDPVASGPRDEIRILAGRPPGRYIDRFGQVWEGDRYFSGGASLPVQTEVITRGFDSNVFSGLREGSFRYEIPLRPGVYELLLLFAETMHGESNPLSGGEAHRIFHVEANGQRLLSEYDVLAEAFDANTATARLFRDIKPGADGRLRLNFTPSTSGKPFVNGIVIRPGIPGRIRPIRIVCRPQAFRDSQNNVWEPDHYYRGGVQITRPHGAPTVDSDRFRGERYGHFTYSIPVPPGKYSARLYFWEYWWGEGRPGKGGPRSRVFDVYANHKPLLLNLDIIARNPKDQYLIETFRGLEPNEQGQLVFEFQPKANNAMVNAIEVFPEN